MVQQNHFSKSKFTVDHKVHSLFATIRPIWYSFFFRRGAHDQNLLRTSYFPFGHWEIFFSRITLPPKKKPGMPTLKTTFSIMIRLSFPLFVNLPNIFKNGEIYKKKMPAPGEGLNSIRLPSPCAPLLTGLEILLFVHKICCLT